jgi:5-(carboxyamino)imidazole ribonucleotide synthase
VQVFMQDVERQMYKLGIPAKTRHNEVAPGQFEQQVRAVCGLPLGSTDLKGPAAMANLLGDVWKDGPPRWERALSNPRLKLHLYGKASARPGRKMGHITATAETPEAAIAAVRQARSSL